jgi:hypothetical protein
MDRHLSSSVITSKELEEKYKTSDLVADIKSRSLGWFGASDYNASNKCG